MNKSSFAMLWRFYWPRMRVHIGIVALVSLLCYMMSLAGMLESDNLGQGLYTVSSFVTSVCLYSAPLLFALYHDKLFTAQIPVSAGTRTGVMALYTYIVIPVAATLPWFAAMGVASLFTDKANVSELFINIAMADESLRNFNLPPMSILAIQQLQVLLPLSVCLYVVACSRRRPMLNGIVSIICSLVGLGILGAVFGILIAYLEVTSSGFDAATFMQRFSSRLVMMATAVATLCTVAGIIMTWALHRKLSYRQL